ncbi:hypothetical protein N8459_02130 [Nitrosopumilus sp.]|nr:hypothetical protein [Nitrosopumilus sp.]
MKPALIIVIAIVAMVGVMVPSVSAQQFDDFDYNIRGGEVLNFEIDSDNASLLISIDARARGELIITLPRSIIDAKVDSEDIDFDVFIRGMQLVSYDETITPYDRTITIPFKRSNDEMSIVGTHVFSQPAIVQNSGPQTIEQIVQSELDMEMPDGKAKLLIFSNTNWSGAYQTSNVDFTEIIGQNNDEVIFECNSTLGSQGMFGTKIQKLTQEGYLEMYLIQNQQIVSQGSTETNFGEVFLKGNCISSSDPTASTNPGIPRGGGCLIATATYGSEMATEVQQLRELRDNQLLQTEYGTAFMGTFNDVYYSFSPAIADMEREHPIFKEVVKLAITPMISSLSLMESAESESEVLVMGLSVIMLNIGMYLGVPAIVIVGIRKKI